jgi:salicylate hydroxylase
LGDGAAKAERDRQFAALRSGGGKGPVPDKWADADVQREIYGFDCTKVAEDNFEEYFSQLSALPFLFSLRHFWDVFGITLFDSF